MNKKDLIEHNEEVFKIIDTFEHNGYLAARINYPNCPYGDKIMVFKGVSRDQLLSQSKINPHFEKTGMTPIARFNPHFDGWNLAVDMVLLKTDGR